MKLIITQPYLNIKGGVERVILRIAQHYKAPIYTLEYNKQGTFEEYKDLDIKIIGTDVPFSGLLPYRASQGLQYGYNFYNLKVKEDYDVLNPHISPSEWIRHNNKNALWYCHTPPREVYDLYSTRMQNRSTKQKLLYATMAHAYKFIAGDITKKIEQIATNSSITSDRVKKYYGRESTVINPGVDYKDFSDNGDGKYFFYPSRILINKRQDYVINAYKIFLKSTKKKNYGLVIAGTLSKDPEHRQYFQKLTEMSKGLNVKFITNVNDSDLKRLYSNATAILFAAINEDFGYIPLESMSSSKPVISVNEGGPTETIVNGKTGFLVNSIEEMAKRMEYLVENKDVAKKMGAAGRKRVTESYSWEAFFKKLNPMLRKVAKQDR